MVQVQLRRTYRLQKKPHNRIGYVASIENGSLSPVQIGCAILGPITCSGDTKPFSSTYTASPIPSSMHAESMQLLGHYG